MPARFHDSILRALRFEMVDSFAELDPRPLFQMSHYFPGEFQVPVEAGADRGAAERQFRENIESAFQSFPRIEDLARITSEFLAEPDRGRVHEMGPPDLDDVPELFRFRFERAVKVLQ